MLGCGSSIDHDHAHLRRLLVYGRPGRAAGSIPGLGKALQGSFVCSMTLR